MTKIRGVNLGNWLVLEKWMNPALFAGTEAEDETWLTRLLPPGILKNRLIAHRESYITEKDFEKIAGLGLNLVRIPVPYFIFGDYPPYGECISLLDRAFTWAEKYGLRILIDLHTTPGCQNGYDNGGIVGVCKWHKDKTAVKYCLRVLERLAARYKDRPGLFGLEVVNEPISWIVWRFAPTTGKAADPAEADGSSHVPFLFLKKYYRAAYRRLRRILPEDKVIVFHDGFRAGKWGRFFREEGMKNVMLDIHPYLWAMEMFEPIHHPAIYRIYLAIQRRRIQRISKELPVLVGEWTACCHWAADLGDKDPEEKKRRYRKAAALELEAWKEAAGWCYWSWKLYPDKHYEGKDSWKEGWDFEHAVSMGWIPGIGEEA